MSAFDEYAAERKKVDVLIAQGYVIAGMKEGLHGSDVQFVKTGGGGSEDSPDLAELRLLSADARKYAAGLVFARQRAAEGRGS